MMQQQVEETPVDAAMAQAPSSRADGSALRKREPAALWRALAGMAMSIALACVIVMLEFTSNLAHRADRLHRRAETLLGRVSRLQTEIAGERARIDTRRRELAAVEGLRALLRAPDAAMMELISPPAPPAAAGGHKVASARRPEATLALAPKEHRAVLMVTGFTPTAADMLLVLWWRGPHGGSPMRAVGFRTAGDGSAIVMAAIPPGLEVTGATITLERVGGASAKKSAIKGGAQASGQPRPTGPVQLLGTLAH
jgi:hypothetical protein